jgi:hypothetical protein
VLVTYEVRSLLTGRATNQCGLCRGVTRSRGRHDKGAHGGDFIDEPVPYNDAVGYSGWHNVDLNDYEVQQEMAYGRCEESR